MSNIPKILHLYWGGGPMSWLQVQTVVTFHKHNPDWAIQVYTPVRKNEVGISYVPEYTGTDWFPVLSTFDYVHMWKVDLQKLGITVALHDILCSDIFRYSVLYEQGGVWSDFDVVWIKPISKLTFVAKPKKEAAAFVCFRRGTEGYHSVGILGAKEKHPMYLQLFEACIRRQCRGVEHQTFGSHLFNELFPNFEILQKQYDDVAGVAYHVFYPYTTIQLRFLYNTTDVGLIKHDTLAVHWFNGHLRSKEFVNNPRHREIRCSINKLINT